MARVTVTNFDSDQTRDQQLKKLGLQVLRFHDRDVKHDIGNVLSCIQNWIEQRVKENDLGHPPTPRSCEKIRVGELGLSFGPIF
jgi:hypothetical protein